MGTWDDAEKTLPSEGRGCLDMANRLVPLSHLLGAQLCF